MGVFPEMSDFGYSGAKLPPPVIPAKAGIQRRIFKLVLEISALGFPPSRD
jgi:hypothetical protein